MNEIVGSIEDPSILDRLDESLSALGLYLQQEWISAALGFLAEPEEVEARGGKTLEAMTWEELAGVLYDQALNANLIEAGDPSRAADRSGVSIETKEALIEGPFVLQVQQVGNISNSSDGRWTDVPVKPGTTPVGIGAKVEPGVYEDDLDENDGPSQGDNPFGPMAEGEGGVGAKMRSNPSEAAAMASRKGSRVLYFELVDGGGVFGYGMEYEPFPAATIDSLTGAKVLLKNVPVRRGLLMLSPDTMMVLGGSHPMAQATLAAARAEVVEKNNLVKVKPKAEPAR